MYNRPRYLAFLTSFICGVVFINIQTLDLGFHPISITLKYENKILILGLNYIFCAPNVVNFSV